MKRKQVGCVRSNHIQVLNYKRIVVWRRRIKQKKKTEQIIKNFLSRASKIYMFEHDFI